jgi:hypothetical protein
MLSPEKLQSNLQRLSENEFSNNKINISQTKLNNLSNNKNMNYLETIKHNIKNKITKQSLINNNLLLSNKKKNKNNINNYSKNILCEEVIDNNLINYDKKLECKYFDNFVNIQMRASKNLSGKQQLLILPLNNFFRNVRNLYILVNILNGRSNISLRIIEYFVVNYVLDNNTYFNKLKYSKHPEFLINNLFSFESNDSNTSSNLLNILNKVNESENNNNIKTSDNYELDNKLEVDNKNKIDDTLKHNINENIVDNEELNSYEMNDFDNFILVHDNYKHQLKQYNKRNFDPFSRGEQIKIYYNNKSSFNTTICQLNFLKWAIENYILDYIVDNIDKLQEAMQKHEKEALKEKQEKLKTAKTRKNNSILQNNINKTNEQKFVLNMSNFSNLDKSNKKIRKKKEFTKTNRSILQYSGRKIISFDM